MKQNQKMKATLTSKFRIGDHVQFPFPGRMVEAVVIEDRGPIGVGGRRLLRLKVVGEDATTGHEIEMPEEELVPA